MTPTDTSTPAPFMHRLVRRGLIVLSVNLLIALLLTLFVRKPFWENLLYSNLSGLCIWAFIETGRHFFWILFEFAQGKQQRVRKTATNSCDKKLYRRWPGCAAQRWRLINRQVRYAIVKRSLAPAAMAG